MHAPTNFHHERTHMQRFSHRGCAYYFDPGLQAYAVFWNGRRYGCRTGRQAKSQIDALLAGIATPCRG